ncbi:hypothetical protein [Halorussus halobius]|uniref:hypothetical protein n=1 Tax=Halorussus halobius TaxID=1710537 RepID=UPI001092EF5F|nr:hypothetical protein [Halorussus halobius]
MDETSPADRDGVSRLSRRGLLALGATLAGTSGIGMFSGSAAAHELMAFRDAFIGDDADKEGLGSKGWLFFAKDFGTIYYHNGSGWVDLGIGGGDGALVDSDDDGLLEASNHDGIDVDQVEANSVSAGSVSITDQLDFGQTVTKTISSGSITADAPQIQLTTESESSDTLTSISGQTETELLIIHGTNGETITIEDKTGNIRVPSNRTLESEADTLTLIYAENAWFELSYANNA